MCFQAITAVHIKRSGRYWCVLIVGSPPILPPPSSSTTLLQSPGPLLSSPLSPLLLSPLFTLSPSLSSPVPPSHFLSISFLPPFFPPVILKGVHNGRGGGNRKGTSSPSTKIITVSVGLFSCNFVFVWCSFPSCICIYLSLLLSLFSFTFSLFPLTPTPPIFPRIIFVLFKWSILKVQIKNHVIHL